MAAVGAGAVLLARNAAKRDRNYNLMGRVVVITGGSRGLGMALGRALAQAGATKLVIAARDQEELDGARRALELHGADVHPVAVDLKSQDAAERLIQEALGRFGQIDVLINNAGTIQVGPLEHMTIEDVRAAMDINFWAAAYTTFAVLPHMRRRQSGRIVNISSIGGKVPVPHLLPYCASKFALTGFSRTLRTELQRAGIVVTTICPGLMRTGSPPFAEFKGQNEKEYSWFAMSDNMPGLSMSAEEAARKIVQALRDGSAELVLGAPAKAGALFDALFPGINSELLAIAAGLLPGPGGIGERSKKGYESETPLTHLANARA
jgi:NAD(P)-dependent dehydrogenase (short-subunit alcohol dehydrogenase family)